MNERLAYDFELLGPAEQLLFFISGGTGAWRAPEGKRTSVRGLTTSPSGSEDSQKYKWQFRGRKRTRGGERGSFMAALRGKAQVCPLHREAENIVTGTAALPSQTFES